MPIIKEDEYCPGLKIKTTVVTSDGVHHETFSSARGTELHPSMQKRLNPQPHYACLCTDGAEFVKDISAAREHQHNLNRDANFKKVALFLHEILEGCQTQDEYIERINANQDRLPDFTAFMHGGAMA